MAHSHWSLITKKSHKQPKITSSKWVWCILNWMNAFGTRFDMFWNSNSITSGWVQNLGKFQINFKLISRRNVCLLFEFGINQKFPCIPLSSKWPKTISNSSYQFQTQYSSLISSFQTHITSLFHLWFVHHFWLREFWNDTFLPKIDFGKCSKFYLKVKVYVTIRFWVPNFHGNLMNFVSCLISHICVPSFLLIMVILHLSNL